MSPHPPGTRVRLINHGEDSPFEGRLATILDEPQPYPHSQWFLLDAPPWAGGKRRWHTEIKNLEVIRPVDPLAYLVGTKVVFNIDEAIELASQLAKSTLTPIAIEPICSTAIKSEIGSV